MLLHVRESYHVCGITMLTSAVDSQRSTSAASSPAARSQFSATSAKSPTWWQTNISKISLRPQSRARPAISFPVPAPVSPLEKASISRMTSRLIPNFRNTGRPSTGLGLISSHSVGQVNPPLVVLAVIACRVSRFQVLQKASSKQEGIEPRVFPPLLALVACLEFSHASTSGKCSSRTTKKRPSTGLPSSASIGSMSRIPTSSTSRNVLHGESRYPTALQSPAKGDLGLTHFPSLKPPYHTMPRPATIPGNLPGHAAPSAA